MMINCLELESELRYPDSAPDCVLIMTGINDRIIGHNIQINSLLPVKLETEILSSLSDSKISDGENPKDAGTGS